MYYVDTNRTVTQRDSSLITTGRRYADDRLDNDMLSTARGGGPSNARFNNVATDSVGSFVLRTRGSVRREITTLLFESMLDYIVDSWDVIGRSKHGESFGQFGKTSSEITFSSKNKRNKSIGSRISKTKTKSRSKVDLIDSPIDPTCITWWNQPDEKAVIRFKNGNIYEGNISWKSMHGEGRFQWTNGTIFLGDFRDNEIVGRGTIKWKDETWYTGDFLGNLRHGSGLYVDSRQQRHYCGSWYCGTKHGKGLICYSRMPINTYDGDWVFNVRHGFGTREYCEKSGYQGEWDQYLREGTGLMVWPNSDCYKGEWQNGVMSGYGMYIWNAYQNYSMSFPSINIYRGCWYKGHRNGFGIVYFGFGMGSHYKGEFKDDKKHGMGKFVTNNGLILRRKQLFIEDSIQSPSLEDNKVCEKICLPKRTTIDESSEFDICDDKVGLQYHVEEAINNLDRQTEIRELLIIGYIENNRFLDSDVGTIPCEHVNQVNDVITENMIVFETDALHKALRRYGKQLKNIYYQYATICNTEPIAFNPVLIRLYLWQFFYDCDMHEKGLTLVEIDDILCKNPDWLVKVPHAPFEKIFFWQFVHCLVAVASKLHAKRCLPGPRPDTIVSTAVRYFMDNDALPNCGRCKGYLPQCFGSFVPLQTLYRLYQSLGEPHTVRTFITAVNRSQHLYMDYPEPDIVEAPLTSLPFGQNAYVFADEMTFRTDDECNNTDENFEMRKDMKLFNFSNLSIKTIIKICAQTFPGVYNFESNRVMDLEIQMTFFEFFQAFVACTEESIRVKDEEINWRELLENISDTIPPARPGTAQKSDKTQK